MTSLPDVPRIVAVRPRHMRDPAPAEEPTTSTPERMIARTMPLTRMALARSLRARLIAPSVRRLGGSLTAGQSRRERPIADARGPALARTCVDRMSRRALPYVDPQKRQGV